MELKEDVQRTQFRAALSSLASGVALITVRDRHMRSLGMTVSSFVSVSMDPLLVLVCVNRNARTYDLIRESGHFGVNLLGREGQALSDYCARPGDDKFIPPRWLVDDENVQASPQVSTAMAFLDCSIHQETLAGTHAIIVGAVKSLVVADPAGEASDPLVYYRGNYHALTPLSSSPLTESR